MSLLGDSNLEERQVRSILNLLDGKVYPAAIESATKHLKKHPQHAAFKTLKAIALVRSGKASEIIEASGLLDEVLAGLRAWDETVVNLLNDALIPLHRIADMAQVFEEAALKVKAAPSKKVEWLVNAFEMHITAGNWKSAHQTAYQLTKMPNALGDDRYVWFATLCATMHAADRNTPPAAREILLKLAYRTVENHPIKPWFSPERFVLVVDLVGAVHGPEAALEKLSSVDTAFPPRRQIVSSARSDWSFRAGRWQEEAERTENDLGSGTDDWDTFTAHITAKLYTAVPPSGSFPFRSPENEPVKNTPTFRIPWQSDMPVKDWPVPELDSEEKRLRLVDAAKSTTMYFRHLIQIFEASGTNVSFKLRLPYLAIFEVERRVSRYKYQGWEISVLDRAAEFERYLLKQGDLHCCAEDIEPYLPLVDGNVKFLQFLQAYDYRVDNVSRLWCTINAIKIRRYLSPRQSAEDDESDALMMFDLYVKSLPLAAVSFSQDTHPADDLAILASQAFIAAYDEARLEHLLLCAIAVLELANSHSPSNPRIGLSLTRLYRLAGCGNLALGHFATSLKPKSAAYTKSVHHAMERASTFYFAPIYTDSEEVEQSYMSARGDEFQIAAEYFTQQHEEMIKSASDHMVICFRSDRVSPVPGVVQYLEQLDTSLTRDLIQLEHSRMTLRSQPPSWELLRPELEEMRFVLTRSNFDDRGWEPLPSWQCMHASSFGQITTLGRPMGVKFLRRFARAYLEAFYTDEEMAAPLEDVEVLKAANGTPATDPTSPITDDANSDKDESQFSDEEEAFLSWASEWTEAIRGYHQCQKHDADKALEYLKRIAVLADFESQWQQDENDEPETGERGWEWVRRDLDRTGGAFWEILHGVTLLHERWIFVTLGLEKLFNGRSKARKRADPISETLATIRASVQAGMSALSAACIVRAEREANSLQELVESCFALKEHIDLPSVLERIVQNRSSALIGLGMSITRVCGAAA